MKKFILNFILFASVILLLVALICIVTDPFNVFHPFNLRDNGVEPNKNYIKTKYVLANPDKFDSFLLGSSRVGSIHVDKIESESCYNMTYSSATPMEDLDTLKVFIDNGIIPRHIYLGLDHESYMEPVETHKDSELRSQYIYSIEHPISFWAKYFSPSMVGNAIISTSLPYFTDSSIPHPLGESYSDIFYNYGWNFDYNYDSPSMPSSSPELLEECHYGMLCYSEMWENLFDNSEYANMSAALDSIQEIVNICEDNNIELTVFTHATWYTTFTEGVSQRYLVFLKRLSEITPYYNFSGFNDITTNPYNYIDIHHYNAEVGDLILDAICYNKTTPELLSQGFGMFVNKDNVDDLIEILLS